MLLSITDSLLRNNKAGRYGFLKNTDGTINTEILSAIESGSIAIGSIISTDSYYNPRKYSNNESDGGNTYEVIDQDVKEDGGHFISVGNVQLRSQQIKKSTIDQFGAVGDKSTDDLLAVRNALNSAAAEVTANKDKNYYLSSDVEVLDSPSIFDGNGATFISDATSRVFYFRPTDRNTKDNKFEIIHLYIVANNPRVVGIRVLHTDNLGISKINIRGSKNGIGIRYCDNFKIRDVHMEDLQVYGVVPTDCNGGTIDRIVGKRFAGKNGSLVETKRSSNISVTTVRGTDLKNELGTGAHGVNVRSANGSVVTNIRVTDVIINGCDKNAVYIHVDDAESSMRNVKVNQITTTDSGFNVVAIRGNAESLIENISVSNVTADTDFGGLSIAYCDNFSLFNLFLSISRRTAIRIRNSAHGRIEAQIFVRDENTAEVVQIYGKSGRVENVKMVLCITKKIRDKKTHPIVFITPLGSAHKNVVIKAKISGYDSIGILPIADMVAGSQIIVSPFCALANGQ